MSSTAHARDGRIDDGRIHVAIWALLVSAAAAQASVASLLGSAVVSSLFWALIHAIALKVGSAQGGQPAPATKRLADGSAVLGLFAFLWLLLQAGTTQALITMLLWMQVAQSFTLTSRRHAYFSLAASFVLLAFASGESRSSWFLAFIAAYSLAGVYTLVLMHASACRQRALGVADDCSASSPRQARLPASVLPLTVAVLALAGLIYLVMPRLPATHFGVFMAHGGQDYSDRSWEREAESGQSDTGGRRNRADSGAREGGERNFDYAGFDDGFDVDAPGAGRTSNAIVLYVQASRALYLTGRLFDTFDGLRWQAADPGSNKLRLDRSRYRFDAAADADVVVQHIEVARPLGRSLFGAARVAEIAFPGSVIAQDAYGALSLPRDLVAGTRYEVKSVIGSVAGHPTHSAERPRDFAPYLQLPADQDPAIGELARRVAGGSSNGLEAALRLEQHLRSEYAYTFDTVYSSQNRTPLVEFLFQTKRGHCEYFASAMAVMLRTLGIPSRLVTGFSATHYNPITGYYEVRALDGHAWVEAWFDAHGWVTFEATAFYDLPREQAATTAGQGLEEYLRELAKVSRVVAPDAAQTDWLRALSELATMLRQTLAHALTWLLERAWDALQASAPAIIAVALACTLGWFAWRKLEHPLRDRVAQLRLRRLRGGEPRRFLLACVHELERWQSRRARPRGASDTMGEYTAELARHLNGHDSELAHLVELFDRARYSAHPITNDDAHAAYAVFLALAAHRS